MNITTDNYEAYLLDYVEGNLSPEGAAELRQFVAAQGLNWDELTEDLPHLEASEITYPDKSKLRSLSLSKGRPSDSTKVVPMYVKIVSAAAAAGLLLTIGLWPEKSLPKVEPIADLMPIKTLHIDTNETKTLLPRRVSESIDPMPSTCLHWDDMRSETPHNESKSMPLLAELSPLKAKETVSMTTTEPDAALEMKMEMLRYRLESDLAFAAMESASFDDEELPTSFIGRTIYRWSEGRYASVNDLVNAGLHSTKQEIAVVTTEMAREAQQRAEEHLADARDYWQEKIDRP